MPSMRPRPAPIARPRRSSSGSISTGASRKRSAGCRRMPASPVTVIYALTATETRPRSEAIEDGALINLRGPAEGDTDGDKLVSIRAWVQHGRAITVTFRHLGGLDDLKAQMEKGGIKDPGDLISHLAMTITKRLDPVINRSGRRGRRLRDRDRSGTRLRNAPQDRRRPIRRHRLSPLRRAPARGAVAACRDRGGLAGGR